MDGLIDTSIIIDMYRGYQPATQWYSMNNNLVLGVSTIVWMEVVEGAPNKLKQQQVIKLLSYFQLIHLTIEDQTWAMREHTKYNLSHNLGFPDALIAAPSHRLNLPIYTRNTKHFLPIIPNLVQKPY